MEKVEKLEKLEKRLIADNISESIRKSTLEKRKAYKNNWQHWYPISSLKI